MKIGLLTHYLALGGDQDSGLGQHFRILADALAADGHQVHVVLATHRAEQARDELQKLAPIWTHEVVCPPNSRLLARLKPRSWPLHLLLENLRLARAASATLEQSVRRLGLEIVETHTYGAPACLFLRRSHRPPVISRVSTTARMVNAGNLVHSRVLHWHSCLERHAMQRSDVLVTHTRQHRDVVCAEENIDPARFSLVPHGLPDPGAPNIFPAHNPEGNIEYLFVGRFEARKGIDVLLAAIPLVSSACPQAVFTLAGAQDDTTPWQAFVRAYPSLAATRVRAPGRISAGGLQDLYRRCSVLVAPSRYESFGLIYPEAMAHGKPVIGTTAGGIPEVVTHEVTGLLARPGDVDSLAESMTRLGMDAGLRDRMGRAGRKDFETRFSAATLARASVALYQQVLGQDITP